MMNTRVNSFYYFFLATLHLCTDSINRTKEDISAIKKIKGNLPIILIFDSFNIDDWVKKFKENPSEFSSQIQDFEVDAIAFDRMYYDIRNFNDLNETFTNALVPWLDCLRTLNPNMNFGIVLFLEYGKFYSTFNFQFLDSYVDFYLINSISKIICFHQEKQKDMPIPDTADKLEADIQTTINNKVDTKKLLYTIDIRVKSVHPTADVSYEDMTYSHLCEVQMSRHRRYCIETIDNIFLKARLRINMNLLGIYVANIDYDDYLGKCECQLPCVESKTFPELNIIIGASQENKYPIDHYKCISGEFPKIVKPKFL
ncbi:uncharacterized protein LOC112684581 isoform X2 [Sipha flava]|uniref:Uncharacterized protein LOC112684581 isoform X2 n=1 Tax=Sipha flava TaxID=143950 RepID=A0A8B8FLZ9_9HEMI|nr:uncharacterized protein LOC112684581 isoform X2 [Sipha flava]